MKLADTFGRLVTGRATRSPLGVALDPKCVGITVQTQEPPLQHNPHQSHWFDGEHIHGTCVCGADCSTHPDAGNPLDGCADCGADTCPDHREYVNNAPVCIDCLHARALRGVL